MSTINNAKPIKTNKDLILILTFEETSLWLTQCQYSVMNFVYPLSLEFKLGNQYKKRFGFFIADLGGFVSQFSRVLKIERNCSLTFNTTYRNIEKFSAKLDVTELF